MNVAIWSITNILYHHYCTSSKMKNNNLVLTKQSLNQNWLKLGKFFKEIFALPIDCKKRSLLETLQSKLQPTIEFDNQFTIFITSSTLKFESIQSILCYRAPNNPSQLANFFHFYFFLRHHSLSRQPKLVHVSLIGSKLQMLLQFQNHYLPTKMFLVICCNKLIAKDGGLTPILSHHSIILGKTLEFYFCHPLLVKLANFKFIFGMKGVHLIMRSKEVLNS